MSHYDFKRTYNSVWQWEKDRHCEHAYSFRPFHNRQNCAYNCEQLHVLFVLTLYIDTHLKLKLRMIKKHLFYQKIYNETAPDLKEISS